MATTEIEPVVRHVERHRGPTLRDWLAPRTPGSALYGWLGPLAVAAFAAFLRFDRLALPRAVVFDETYYAKDALGLLKFGYEHNTIKDADKVLLSGSTDIWAPGGSFVAHPPAGKWMIAIGEQIFGATPFGWRFSAALFGSLSVLILARVARRMTGSTLLGCAAGLLLALDGLHLVTSRTAVLDIFVMFWVLAAFACLVIDRERSRAALADRLEGGTGALAGTSAGPQTDAAIGAAARTGPFVMHWWRIAAGLCLGMAVATKWTGVFYIVAFGLMTLAWDMGARRSAQVRSPYWGAVLLDGLPSFVSLVVLAGVTYVASWWGWIFRKPGGWGRGHVSDNVLARPFEAMPRLWHYHQEIWNFHTNLHAKHLYQSWPWDWPILRRPVAFFYTEPKHGCVGKCSREVLGIGTPAIWWAAMAAILVLMGWWLMYRDWRAGAILLGYLAGWLPWFYYAFHRRTMFLFYATPMLPFMVLALVLVLGLLIGPAEGQPLRRWIGAVAAGAYILVVILNFWYFYPVLAAKVISYHEWHQRVRFNSWI